MSDWLGNTDLGHPRLCLLMYASYHSVYMLTLLIRTVTNQDNFSNMWAEHPRGRLQPQRETLALGLSILSPVIGGEQAC